MTAFVPYRQRSPIPMPTPPLLEYQQATDNLCRQIAASKSDIAQHEGETLSIGWRATSLTKPVHDLTEAYLRWYDAQQRVDFEIWRHSDIHLEDFDTADLARAYGDCQTVSQRLHQLTDPASCLDAASDYNGTVAAAFRSSVGAIRRLPAVASNPQLAGYADTDVATVCYIDGHIPKRPPPRSSGTIPPSF